MTLPLGDIGTIPKKQGKGKHTHTHGQDCRFDHAPQRPPRGQHLQLQPSARRARCVGRKVTDGRRQRVRDYTQAGHRAMPMLRLPGKFRERICSSQLFLFFTPPPMPCWPALRVRAGCGWREISRSRYNEAWPISCREPGFLPILATTGVWRERDEMLK